MVKGKHLSEETRRKMSLAHRKYNSPETRKKISLANKGKTLSEETRRKLSLIAKNRLGDKSSNWRGGKMVVGGYVYVLSPQHPNRTKDGYVCEHRLVMEQHKGRYLEKTEAVHHKNGNKLDNRIENLELCRSNGEHFLEKHLKQRDALGKFSSR